MEKSEVRDFIKLIFEQYQQMKKNNILYNDDDKIPQTIIHLYYQHLNNPSFNDVITEFKKKYIFNETKLEEATNKERLGLGEMYDYIKEYDCNKKINIYLLLRLHQLIFSKCDYPEFGGSFRNDNRYLPGSGVIIPEYDFVPDMIAKLFVELNQFMTDTEKSKCDNNVDIISYINKCIDIKCRIIEIHPFSDGNGRSARGFVNLLFKNVGLPPVYVEPREKSPYCLAMNKAIVNNDYKDIYKFYYYKICDSIYELDVKNHKNEDLLEKIGSKSI